MIINKRPKRNKITSLRRKSLPDKRVRFVGGKDELGKKEEEGFRNRIRE